MVASKSKTIVENPYPLETLIVAVDIVDIDISQFNRTERQSITFRGYIMKSDPSFKEFFLLVTVCEVAISRTKIFRCLSIVGRI